MKKAQILSAIALAFALGVVAPVAATYADEPATQAEVADPATGNKATYQEVVDAIAKASKDVKYVAYANVDKALADTANTVPLATSGLTTPFTTLGINAVVTGTLYQQVSALVATAESVTDFAAWSTLTTRVAEAKGLSASATDSQKDTAKANLIAAINAVPGVTTYQDDGETLQQVIDYVEGTGNVVVKNNGVATKYDYATMSALVTTTQAQKASLKAAEDLQTALNNVVSFMPENTSAQKTAKENALNNIKAQFDGATPIADLRTLAANDVASGTTYAALKAVVTTAVAEGQTESAYYNTLQSLNTAFENFTGYELKNSTATPGTTTPETVNAIASANGIATIEGKFEAGKYYLDAGVYKEAIEALKDFKYGAYDITLKDAKNNAEVQPEGTVKVTVKNPEGIDGTKARIYHVNEEGKLDLVKDSKYDKDADTFTFTTDHFSIYAVVEDNNVLVPGAGVLNIKDNNASTAVSIMAGIATALTAAGAGIVAYRNARRSKEA